MEKIADYIAFIDNGKMIYSGEKDKLSNSFQKIVGERHNVNKEQREKILGYHENNTIFEGLISKNILSEFSNFTIRPATMDELMVFMHKGETEDE